MPKHTHTTVTLEDLAALKAGGYQVQRLEDYGWVLSEISDQAPLMVAEYGCVSPTKWEAVAEGLQRIADDARIARVAADARAEVSPLFDSSPFRQIRGQVALTWDGEPLDSPDTVRELEAAGAGALEAAAAAELQTGEYRFYPDRGEPVTFTAVDRHEAARIAAERFHRIPGILRGYPGCYDTPAGRVGSNGRA